MGRTTGTLTAKCTALLLLLLTLTALVYAQNINDSPVLDADVTEQLCMESSDCADIGDKKAICQEGVCVEDALFPLSKAEIIGSICAFVAGVLAAGSGLGGGGLLVPLYILAMGLSSHEAVPLSKATIFGSSIASFVINVRAKHPVVRDRPLIDYETVLMMEPMTLAGTIIGVNMNAVFPEWLITVCIVLLLTKTAQRTFTKGLKIFREEGDADKKILSDIVSYWRLLPHESNFKQFQAVARAYLKWKSYKRPSEEKVLKLPNPQEDECNLQNTSSFAETEDDSSDGNEEEALIHNAVKEDGGDISIHMLSLEKLKKYRRGVPYGDMVVLFFTWVGLVLFSMLKGGHGSPSIVGLQCGSVGYWSLIAVSFPFFVAVTLYFGTKISRVHTIMNTLGYEYAKGDMVWDKAASIKYPALCTAAGVAAGLLGIGGGMVKGPLLLEMGLIPQVSSATSSAMILFTSSATTIQFIILGTLSVEHALWHGTIGLISGVIGQYGMSYLIRKYRKASFVIFLIAVVVGVSGLIMGVLGFSRIMEIGIGGFRSLCA